MKKDLKDKGKRERLWYKKVNQKEKAHTCSENQKLTRKKYAKHGQSNRKSSYKQQESLRNEKDIKSTYNREEKAFTCGENHLKTRKRLNNYTGIII